MEHREQVHRHTIRTVLFSTLYPSNARPQHGIFVETRLRQLLASEAVTSRVVAPVPWFPSGHPCFGEWATWAKTPHYEFRHGIEIWHPRYALLPKVGMSIAPVALALGARPTIARFIDEGWDFDLFDAHYYYPDGAAAALLSRWFNKPFVVTARGTDLNVLPAYAIPRRWIRWTEKHASASIGVSRSLTDRLISLGGTPSRTHVLRNGVDLNYFRLLERQPARDRLGLPDGRWLLSVGNLVELKGHHIAIEALAQLPNDTRLAIVGSGEEHNRLQALANKLGVASRVMFAGARPQAELIHWYNAADVLALCSSREGWPNVLLEALACGTPVVATAVSGTPEIVQSSTAGRLLRERSPAALTSAVLDIFASDVERDRIREYASAFGWTETTQGQTELFDTILRHRVSRG